jgi:UDP-N-acetylglucosamine 2-epimerase (non-hydrolysing)
LDPQSPLMVICGTRPEAIKLAPLVRALRARNHRVVLVATGQHPDLMPGVFADRGIGVDHSLPASRPGSSPQQLLGEMLLSLPPLIAAVRPSLALVQGDTISTVAGALAASYAAVPVGHVEAGLRSRDRDEPFPEESNRRLVSAVASLHFAPTNRAAAALLAEGIDPMDVHLTGNTGIDALMEEMASLATDDVSRARMVLAYPFVAAARAPLALVTVHRRENLGRRLGAISAGLARIAETGLVELVLPLHPNPSIGHHFRERLGDHPAVHLLPAVPHRDMVWLMQQSRLLITDSGGLQEEAPALGLATLVLRGATERPEALACGSARLVDRRADRMVAAVAAQLAAPAPAPALPFGDGRAAARIARVIEDWLGLPVRDRVAA